MLSFFSLSLLPPTFSVCCCFLHFLLFYLLPLNVVFLFLLFSSLSLSLVFFLYLSPLFSPLSLNVILLSLPTSSVQCFFSLAPHLPTFSQCCFFSFSCYFTLCLIVVFPLSLLSSTIPLNVIKYLGRSHQDIVNHNSKTFLINILFLFFFHCLKHGLAAPLSPRLSISRKNKLFLFVNPFIFLRFLSPPLLLPLSFKKACILSPCVLCLSLIYQALSVCYQLLFVLNPLSAVFSTVVKLPCPLD
ncbi:unnamed protein product [Acanthosepion pharaonis]|uniref:Uncharacterized protein n=1 Tax=Acanthosepion pharaonis TaxID=158019 RepID=A0A812CKA0_ACAPH|nr:unnamed protein product [Sepia pharaonis]